MWHDVARPSVSLPLDIVWTSYLWCYALLIGLQLHIKMRMMKWIFSNCCVNLCVSFLIAVAFFYTCFVCLYCKLCNKDRPPPTFFFLSLCKFLMCGLMWPCNVYSFLGCLIPLPTVCRHFRLFLSGVYVVVACGNLEPPCILLTVSSLKSVCGHWERLQLLFLFSSSTWHGI